MINDILIYLCSFAIYTFIIIIPTLIYIKKKKTKDIGKFLKLKDNYLKGILAGTIISVFYISILIIKGKLTNTLNLNLNIGVRWFYGLSVGLLEEIPMRGFLLNEFQEKFPFWKANILVTLVFIFLHFPTWILGGVDIFQSALRISLLSLALGYLVNEYDSLWPAVICHSVFNLSIWIGLA